MAEALYRKYRPQVFEDVVGQEHIERTIKNAIERDKVSHAYLFTGPRGTGKTTTARLLAKALLCQRGPSPEPDGTCEDCELIAAGEHPDVYELDAASRTGVENVREEIIGRVQFAPTRGRYKIYIIDEVHMLSTAAFNALLKTLEEPPGHVVFILATTDPQKVPETIHSRCQRFDFRRISNDSIVSRLGAICVSEGVEFEGEALELIAHRAEGGMRNALTSLEQLIAFGEGRVTMDVAERMLGALDSSDLAEIVRFVGARDVAACFRWTAEYVETGSDLAQFTRDFAERIRNLYVMSLAGAEAALDVTDAARREMVQELPMFGPDRLARLLGVLGDLSAELKTSTNPRLSFEIALTRMVRPESDLTLEGLAARIEELEAKLAQGAGFAQSSGFAAMPATTSKSEGSLAETPRFPAQNPSDLSGVEPSRAFEERLSGVGGQSAQGAYPESSARSGAFPSLDARQVEAGSARIAAPEESNLAPAQPAGVSTQLAAQLGNPAALQRLWQAVLAALKKAKTAYGVLFLNTKAVFDEAAGVLIIDFPAENEFAFKAVQKPDVQDELARCIEGACGVALPFSLRKGGAEAVPASQQAQACASARPSAEAGAAFPVRAQEPVRDARQGFSPTFGQQAQPQQPVAQAVPASQPVTQAAPDYDGPPLDAYDDYVPYGDDGYGYVPAADSPPWEDPAPARSAVQPASAPQSENRAAADVPPWEAYAAPPATQAAAEPSGQSAPPSAEGEPSASDLDAALAFGFGAGVSFTEV